MAPGADDLVDRPSRTGPRRVGIFGGTFDPPHLGHVSVARDVADDLGLDEVIWMPAGRSPHKPDADLTRSDVRLAMVRAAADVDPRFSVDDRELKREGPSFTIDTLREVRHGALGADVELFLIIGMDQYRSFESWRDPDGIRALVTLAVMDRGGEGVADAGVVRVLVGRVDVSSTVVRERVAAGVEIDDLVPPAVADVIERERLFRTPDGQ